MEGAGIIERMGAYLDAVRAMDRKECVRCSRMHLKLCQKAMDATWR